jgi:nitrite reductase (cytochrome c-552)
MSPLKQDSMPCKACHPKTDEELRAQVIAIQEHNLAMLVNAGYEVATVARLFQTANASLETTVGDPVYDEAARHYRQAFYRVVYMGAENSVGFHNPGEAERILRDARAEATAADAALRGLLASKRVRVPGEIPLDLRTYLDGRGVRKLDFRPKQQIPDPSGRAQKTWPRSMRSLTE